jgi:hypothetical protein
MSYNVSGMDSRSEWPCLGCTTIDTGNGMTKKPASSDFTIIPYVHAI